MLMSFTVPVKDIRFTLDAIAGLPALGEAFPELNADVTNDVLQEAAKFAGGVLAPLNASGDRDGAKKTADGVVTAPGFRDAWRQFAEGGWNGLTAPTAYGGQGMPHTLGTAVAEMWQGANLAFALGPMLTQGVIEALATHGSQEQQAMYLPKLISGEWSGTMNLTEPQAGSDVGALKTRAEPTGDGSYKLTGTKIFITWGEHDCSENIVHMVLARITGAPEGTRGISLFLVPKFLVNADDSKGARNDVVCAGLEHKMGIHASPTCVMNYGERGGATGYLVGGANEGMARMFTMMNAARLGVGIQGVGLAEAAFQKALSYAKERRQGRLAGSRDRKESVLIIEHPDVRRMLMTMKALTEATRALCYANAMAIDTALHSKDAAEAAKAKARGELLIPLAKAWPTDIAVEVASLGVQVHGGMGFIEETGAAQFYRDARILPIYEGTNGIQALDLVGRKLAQDGGAAVAAFITEIAANAAALGKTDGALKDIGAGLAQATATLGKASQWIGGQLIAGKIPQALAGATPYLKMFATVAGGHYLALGAKVATDQLSQPGTDKQHLTARIAVARFFARNILPEAQGLLSAITEGSGEVLEAFPQELLP
jgi:3-(methylthio)propanoyl-CoA dehydrogenase